MLISFTARRTMMTCPAAFQNFRIRTSGASNTAEHRVYLGRPGDA
jgi:hypothetical protein